MFPTCVYHPIGDLVQLLHVVPLSPQDYNWKLILGFCISSFYTMHIIANTLQMLDIQNFFNVHVVAIQDSANNPTISNMSNLSTVTTTATVQAENSIIFVSLPDRSTVW